MGKSSRNYLLLSISVALLTSFLSACSPPKTDPNLKIFKYNESTGIQSLDPAFASGQSGNWICHQLYNGLVDLNDSLEVVPAIAKAWEISEDGKTYTFTLRNNVYFHDVPYAQMESRPVTAHDFEYSLSRIVDPAVASPGAWIFQHVAQDDTGKHAFTALNDTTFQIQLKNSFPPFLSILAMKYCSVLPRETVEYYGKEFRKYPVGTGPFHFQYWEEGVKLVLRKNPTYFEKDETGTSLPYIDGVAITFVVDKQSVFMEFMKGKLDFMSGIDPSYKDALLTKDGELNPAYQDQISLITAPYLNTEYLGFLLKGDDSESNPLLIKEVRQAINHGFDRAKMIRYMRNNIGYAASSGFVPMGMPSFNPEVVQGYDYNPEKAQQLLATAGYPNGAGLPPISLSVSAMYLDLCQYIQFELGKLGIEVKLDVQQAAQQRQMMRGYQLPFFRGSWVADYPDAENYLSLFYSKNLQPAGSNYTHYVNPTYDQLFEETLHITNDSLRNRNYTQLDSILMADAPVVVLFYDKVVRFIQNNIHQMNTPATNMLDLRRVRKGD